MLTPKQKELLDFIIEFSADHGYSPSFEEMRGACGLQSKSGIFRMLTALEERGFIRRLKNRRRAIEVCVRGSPRSLRGVDSSELLLECVNRGLIKMTL